MFFIYFLPIRLEKRDLWFWGVFFFFFLIFCCFFGGGGGVHWTAIERRKLDHAVTWMQEPWSSNVVLFRQQNKDLLEIWRTFEASYLKLTENGV